MNKRYLDSYIRRQTRLAVRFYADADVKSVAQILAGTGIGLAGGLLVGKLIASGLTWLFNKIADRRILQQILDGTISEERFVKNFVDQTVNQLHNDLPRTADYDANAEKGAKIIEQRLRRCRTVKGLLRVMPNNEYLIRMDRILSDPRVQEKMGIERLGRDFRQIKGAL
jgi:hypothetical protein